MKRRMDEEMRVFIFISLDEYNGEICLGEWHSTVHR
jgi:hypothetical protein